MRWALLALALACAGHRVTNGPEPVPLPDAMARGFALRAWVAEARGDAEEARRSWAWVERLDASAWPRVHRGDALRRLGDGGGASQAYDAALALDPDHPDARLGQALIGGSDVALGPFLGQAPCRLATDATGSVRRVAEEACRGR